MSGMCSSYSVNLVEDYGSLPVSQENSTLGKFDAASIFPRKFDRLNFLKRQFFLRIYGRL